MLMRERGYTQSYRDFKRAMRCSGEQVLIGDPEYGSSRRHLLFTYGTMKLGFRNHERIKYGAKFVTNSVTKEATFNLLTKTESYMAPIATRAVPRDSGYKITGEVYEVDGALLELIDLHEGHPYTYERERVPVEGVQGPVWMYLYLGDSLKISARGIQVDEENRAKTFIQRG